MKIEKGIKTKNFDSIQKGEVFCYQGFYFIKIEDYYNTKNAVNLDTGYLQYFDSSFEVEPCPNAILKIN